MTPQILSFALQQLNLRDTVYILSSSSAPATAFVRPTLSQCINLTTCLTHTDRQQQHGTTPMADTLYSGAECCDEHVSLSVYRSGCPNAYLRNRTSKLPQVFFSVLACLYPWLGLFWSSCDMLCILLVLRMTSRLHIIIARNRLR